MSPTAFILGLAARGYRSSGLAQVDLFWSGADADGFDVFRDGRRIATVAASGYTDRISRAGSGRYRYRVRATGMSTCSNEAVVTFTEPDQRAPPALSSRQAGGHRLLGP